ncbi:MAG: DUF882 domain-containing protein [Inquilinus sp.]|nr:DUF882 domain-containing protein [Inquilinus sp.]
MAGLAGCLAGAVVAPRGRRRSAPLPATRRLDVHALHTGERLSATYCRNGAYDSGALAEINHVLRDWRSGDVHRIDPGLLDLLATLRGKAGGSAPFELISGYRSPATNAALASNSGGVARRSLHMEGMAADVRLPGVDLATLHREASAMRAGGVGLYTRSNFVHVDTGRVRYWGS